MTWLAIGRAAEDGAVHLENYRSAQAATRAGRDRVGNGTWRSFRVAKVTAAYYRGAVRQ